ncbi:MAG TPA: hypothetical protein VJ847_00660 [Gemmatimonadales bacterium]|jgi:hypothetical protein|nr:hypothetical protein [Gemmatimonadales bacterium]
MEGVLALSIPIVFILTLGAVFIARGPIGHAVARAIGGHAGEAELEVVELRQQVEQLRVEMGDMQERMDFAERLLARPGDADRLKA